MLRLRRDGDHLTIEAHGEQSILALRHLALVAYGPLFAGDPADGQPADALLAAAGLLDATAESLTEIDVPTQQEHFER